MMPERDAKSLFDATNIERNDSMKSEIRISPAALRSPNVLLDKQELILIGSLFLNFLRFFNCAVT